MSLLGRLLHRNILRDHRSRQRQEIRQCDSTYDTNATSSLRRIRIKIRRTIYPLIAENLILIATRNLYITSSTRRVYAVHISR